MIRKDIQKRKIVHVMLSLLFATLYVMPSSASAALTDFKTIKAAQAAYQKKDYNTSVKLLRRLDKPSPQRNYDLGNAYYKAGQLDKALSVYKRAKGKGVDEEKRLHNIGNIYFKKKQYNHAITAYEAALKIHDDADTRFNLELAKKMKKKQEKKKKQQQKKKQKKQQNKKNQQKKKQNQKKQNQKNKNNKNKQQQKSKDKKGNQSKSKPKPGDKKQKPKNQPGKKEQKKKPEQKKGDKKQKEQAKAGKEKQKKKPEKAQGASQSKQARAQKIQAKEIKRLMKQLKGKKMQPRLYQFVGKKRPKNNTQTVNPW